jgi:hypothetical protein
MRAGRKAASAWGEVGPRTGSSAFAEGHWTVSPEVLMCRYGHQGRFGLTIDTFTNGQHYELKSCEQNGDLGRPRSPSKLIIRRFSYG